MLSFIHLTFKAPGGETVSIAFQKLLFSIRCFFMLLLLIKSKLNFIDHWNLTVNNEPVD